MKQHQKQKKNTQPYGWHFEMIFLLCSLSIPLAFTPFFLSLTNEMKNLHVSRIKNHQETDLNKMWLRDIDTQCEQRIENNSGNRSFGRYLMKFRPKY